VISYGKQSINQDDIDAVIEVLKSDFLTQGPKVVEFEAKLAKYCNSKYVKVVSNATSALHLAYLAIGLKKNDIMWTSPNTFIATANAALYCGAKVEFIDIDEHTYNISISSLREKLQQAKIDNKLPKLVVPVHFAGQSCEMKEIWELSKEFGFKVIEDASHALGAEYLGDKVGCSKYSNMSVFSFHPVKMITTGEGGAIMTNDQDLDLKLELLRSHGVTKEKKNFVNKNFGDWYYEQKLLGFNYRLTDIQAALGISQLKRLDIFVKKRNKIAQKYLKNLNNVILPRQQSSSSSSWHLFVVQVKNRDMVYQKLKSHGIMSQVHYIPINLQPFYKKNTLKNSYKYFQNCLSLPIYADLLNEEQMKIIDCLNND
jgi:UDP-4-amino-4,6-dideoxy-N-acetyl-beta-L-altrosamine transaminase